MSAASPRENLTTETRELRGRLRLLMGLGLVIILEGHGLISLMQPLASWKLGKNVIMNSEYIITIEILEKKTRTIFRCMYNTTEFNPIISNSSFFIGVVQAMQSNKNQIKESLMTDQHIPPDLYVSQRDLEELSQIGHVLQGPAKHID